MGMFNLEKQENNKINTFVKSNEELELEIENDLKETNREINELEHSASLNSNGDNSLKKVFLKIGVGADKIHKRLDYLYKHRHSLENRIAETERVKKDKKILH